MQGALGQESPRVLFLGDPIHRRVMVAAAKELDGKIRLEFPKATANDTGTALTNIDKLLGDGDWDLIYFNFGLGDLFYKDPSTREIRAMSKLSGGVRVTSPVRYAENLEKLVLRLKRTRARLVWGTTIPLVNVNSFPSYKGNLYDAGSAAAYNKIAAKVMARHAVPVNDLHTYVLAQFDPDAKHPGFADYVKALMKMNSPLHKPVIECLLEQLDMSDNRRNSIRRKK